MTRALHSFTSVSAIEKLGRLLRSNAFSRVSQGFVWQARVGCDFVGARCAVEFVIHWYLTPVARAHL